MPTFESKQPAAILFSDIAGYTALMERDEAGTLARLEQLRQLFDRLLDRYGGQLIKDLGDGHLVVFREAAAAVGFAADLQRELPAGPALPLRVGLHWGELTVSGKDVYGTAVNIASRVESFALPGAVLVSAAIYEALLADHRFNFQSLGKFLLKNVAEPMELFAVAGDGLVVPDTSELSGKGRQARVLHQLPQYLTSFIGREEELAVVRDLVLGYRLVTITGTGGTGKSRLAVQAAKELEPHFSDGIYWVELAPVADPELVVFSIAKSLGLDQDPLRSMDEVIAGFLQMKTVLLILDNFEQVVEAAPLVETLLLKCADLRVLVTSRVLLRLMGEMEFAAPPLPLPRLNGQVDIQKLAGNPAVQLFCQRAQASRRHFALNPDNGRAVAEICIRLDGLPLAIELAAARAKLFSPQKMLARLENRLDELKGSSRSLPDRHRTIRNAIQWSYDLLEREEQELFRRLSVFVGGCSVEAAEEVCGRNGLGGYDVVDGVLALVDKSLLRSLEGDEPRFFMLETIREFSRQALQTSQKESAYQVAHAEYFLTLAENTQPHLSGPDQSEWMALLDQEQDNFRAALDFTIQSGDYEKAYRLGSALRPFWGSRGLIREAERQLERLQQLPAREELKKWRLKILQDLGVVYFYIPRFPKAVSLFEETLAYWEGEQNRLEIAKTLNNLGWTVLHLGQYRQAIDYSERALAIGRELGNQHLVIGALNNMAWVCMEQLHPKKAEAFFRQTIAITEAIGDERRNGYAKFAYAWTNRVFGQYQTATELLEEALVIHRRNKDAILTGISYAELAVVNACTGNYEAATTFSEEAIHFAREAGGAIFIFDHVNEALAIAAISSEDAEMAREVGASIKSINDQIVAHYRNVRNRILLGQLAFFSGQLAEAWDHCRKAIALDRDRDSFLGILPGLELAGLLFATEGQWANAGQLTGKAAAIRDELQVPPYPHEKRWLDESRMTAVERIGKESWELQLEKGRRTSLEKTIGLALDD